MNHPTFLETLFDLSFRRFVVVRIVRVLYALAICTAAAALIGMLFCGLSGWDAAQRDIDALTATGGDIALLASAVTKRGLSIALTVSAPVVSAACLLMSRVACELVVVIFTIAERLSPSAAPSPSPQTPQDPSPER